MSKAPSDPRLIGFLLLATTILAWGLNWPAVKVLLLEWPPFFSRGVAGVAAAALLAGIALWRGESLAVPSRFWPRLGFAAFTNVFAWMGFGTLAMKYLPISEAALLAYTMPIWTMLFAWPILGERPTLRSVIALVLAFAGLAVLRMSGSDRGTAFVSVMAGLVPAMSTGSDGSYCQTKQKPRVSGAFALSWRVIARARQLPMHFLT
jgi:drug/metabolite transporter (DMT)-like permease